MIYIGIDPGASGGIAWLNELGCVTATKMPETERDIWTALHIDPLNCFALIEKVHSMPGEWMDKKTGQKRRQGIASTFKFGQNYGMLRMALIACEIPFDEVSPQTWQKAIGCLTHGDKNVSKAKAQQLFPSICVTHAVADALLIAEYCRRTHQGTDHV